MRRKLLGIILLCILALGLVGCGTLSIDVDTNINVELPQEEVTLADIERGIFEAQIAFVEKYEEIEIEVEKLKSEELKDKDVLSMKREKLVKIMEKYVTLRSDNVDTLSRSFKEAVKVMLSNSKELTEEQIGELTNKIYKDNLELTSTYVIDKYKKVVGLLNEQNYEYALDELVELSATYSSNEFWTRCLIVNNEEYMNIFSNATDSILEKYNYKNTYDIQKRIDFNNKAVEAFEKYKVSNLDTLKASIEAQNNSLTALIEKKNNEAAANSNKNNADEDEDYSGVISNGNSTAATEKYIKVNDTDERVFAWMVAEQEVKARLKSPSTAKFPFSAASKDVDIQKSGDTYVVKSYVEAQNSLGAVIKNNFTVKFTRDGDKYTILEVNIN